MKEKIRKQKNSNSAPLIIIQKESDNSEKKEYCSIEKAITELEKNINIPKEKLEQLRKSMHNLKYKSSILIKNGEIIN